MRLKFFKLKYKQYFHTQTDFSGGKMRRTSQDSQSYRRVSQDATRKRSTEWVRRGSMEVTKLGNVCPQQNDNING